MNNLGTIIKNERESLNLSRDDLSKKIGVSYSAIAMYEQGHREPNIEMLYKMCNIFNCSMDYLMGLTYYKNPKDELEINQKLIDILDKLTQFDIDELERIINGSFSSIGKCIKPEIYLIESFHTEQLNLSETSFLIKYLCMHFEECYYLYPLSNGFHKFSTLQFKDFVRLNVKEYKNMLPENHTWQSQPPKQYYMCPVYGQISAGQPNWAEENIEGTLPIDPNLMGIVNPEEHFFLRVNRRKYE